MPRYSINSAKYYSLMFKEYPDVVDVKTLQKMLNIGERRAYELVNTGAIAAIRFPHAYRIPKAAIIEYLMSNIQKEGIDSQ